MHLIQGLLFLFFGVGLLWVDYRSLSRGWLPCGPNGFRGRVEFHRDRQPLGYWLMFVVYGAAGLWLTGFAIGLLLGWAQPLPLA
ncbi:MAG: hypothetical protein KIS72_12385 [Luteimonas sp.]|nr:hypothetical protein [Luteimonas sp.]